MAQSWSCGIGALPGTVKGGPVVGVLWTCQGFVVHIGVFEGRTVDDLQLRRSFDEAVAKPAKHAPRGKPKRIRVADPALARRLRKLLPKVRVEVGPTPDVVEVLESMAQELGARPTPIEEFMELDETVREALMPAALGLFELRPWQLFPPEPAVRVVIAGCDLKDGRISIMGHGGEVFGFMLFRSGADHAVLESERAPETVPTCYSLNYEPVPTSALSGDPEDTGDFPLPVLTVFEGGAQRAPDREEARLLIAAALGLSRFMTRRATQLMSPGGQTRGIKGKYRVQALGEKLEVRVSFKL